MCYTKANLNSINKNINFFFFVFQIVRFFNDEDSDHSPFSLHELVRVGEASGKKPGDWYGPNSVAHTIWYYLSFY